MKKYNNMVKEKGSYSTPSLLKISCQLVNKNH